MSPNPQETADLVTFTEEILSGKLYFLCSFRKLRNFKKISGMLGNKYKQVPSRSPKMKILAVIQEN